MLEIPIAAKIMPLVLAGWIALSGIILPFQINQHKIYHKIFYDDKEIEIIEKVPKGHIHIYIRRDKPTEIHGAIVIEKDGSVISQNEFSKSENKVLEKWRENIKDNGID
jgi:hypothetical protein